MSFLILEDDMPEVIWSSINNQQIVFHPRFASGGSIDMNSFFELKRKKEVQVFFDRNLFSSLLKITKEGQLQNQDETKLIALLMVWTHMNDIPISSGFALRENAYRIQNSNNAKIELQQFTDIFEFYPAQIWLELFAGVRKSLPILTSSSISILSEVSYHNPGDHFLMNYVSMLHLARVFRCTELTPIEKIMEFWNWNFDKLLISQYTNTYLVLLMGGQDSIKAPNGVNSTSIDKLLLGCKNQAWDLTYLTDWSTMYSDEMNGSSDTSFFFATADHMLKRIFINTHAGGNLFDLIKVVFNKKDAHVLCEYFQDKMSTRITPEFGNNPRIYFQTLIDNEIQMLRNEIAMTTQD